MPKLIDRLFAAVTWLAVASSPTVASAATPSTPTAASSGVSPASCGAGDVREPGIQGDVPAGESPHYACGVRLVGQLPVSGNVAGTGTCVYVRSRGAAGTPDEATISVIDTRNPARPAVVGAPIPVHNGSESLRLVVTANRAVMVSGSTVLDIADCLHPKVLGEIRWPDTSVPGVSRKNLPHDIRLNRAGTRVFASFGVWEVNLDNLADPASWTIVDHRCELAAQLPGAWQEIHRRSLAVHRSLCDDATRPAPRGANYAMGGSPLQASLLWPQVSHSPDFNADDTRLYVGDQSGGNMALWSPVPQLHVIDITQSPYRVIGTLDGPGHGLDWFRSGTREYLLHSNEGGTKGIMGQPERGDPCRPYPRPASLGWAFEAFISDVTDPAHAARVAMLPLAINSPAFCARRKASGRDPWLAYHLIDRTENPRFAALNFGDAGLRIFDIRDPVHPVEAAYFNHGAPVHAQVGYYDAARRLLFFSDSGGLKVLAFEPQVRRQLGL